MFNTWTHTRQMTMDLQLSLSNGNGPGFSHTGCSPTHLSPSFWWAHRQLQETHPPPLDSPSRAGQDRLWWDCTCSLALGGVAPRAGPPLRHKHSSYFLYQAWNFLESLWIAIRKPLPYSHRCYPLTYPPEEQHQNHGWDRAGWWLLSCPSGCKRGAFETDF